MDKENTQKVTADGGLAGKADPAPIPVGFTFVLAGQAYRVRKVVYRGREIVARRVTLEQLQAAANTAPKPKNGASKVKAKRAR